MRTTYRRRRIELAQMLAACSLVPRLAGVAAGLHALVLLPEEMDAEQTLRRAARAGLALRTLTEFRHLATGPQALVVGYGAPADHAFRPALTALARLLDGPE
ncbi:hypothetical protein ACFPOI_26140 [Nonomuraea angiospora]|uniref:DNA-binding transcriptional MocR family regulator n=1 Tax=Nonomuraea angiospora TaxID=46172 RepID=A0ABR9LQ03_9ACTN|nr:hypothetical protein [Nonomuraea angiospora]MBE1582357.1 DNA-binding transcriptional MocR family regulator [Nonomuraea angiospora]